MADNTEARTALVADDNDDARRVVRWMLEQKGYAVIELKCESFARYTPAGSRPV